MLSQAKPIRRSKSRNTPAAESPRVIAEMTYAQFLQLPADVHAEWVDGKVIEMPAVTDEHSALQAFFMKVVGVYVDAHHLGEVRAEPFQMKPAADLPGRSPDLLFVARRNLSRLKKLYLDGPADLVVEILSPGTVSVDRGDKYAEYERGGVREYWLVDPMRKQLDAYLRRRDGLYQRIVPDERDVVRSSVIKGMWIDANWLWRKPLPSSMQVLKAWGLA